jgi:hypothetical protein
MIVKSIKPKWGENYDFGFIGFSYSDKSFISRGIAYFERWTRLSDIKVSHTFVVSGPDEVIEAQPKGVVRATLSQYFNNPHALVFFRKPVGWTPEMGRRIVSAAEDNLGDAYGFSVILARFLANNCVGHVLNRLLGSVPDRLVTRLLDSRHQMICSELVAHCLKVQPELAGRGVLRRPEATVEPQALFEDPVVFEPWKAQAHGRSPRPVQPAPEAR